MRCRKEDIVNTDHRNLYSFFSNCLYNINQNYMSPRNNFFCEPEGLHLFLIVHGLQRIRCFFAHDSFYLQAYTQGYK